jgi:hypothetical protein
MNNKKTYVCVSKNIKEDNHLVHRWFLENKDKTICMVYDKGYSKENILASHFLLSHNIVYASKAIPNLSHSHYNIEWVENVENTYDAIMFSHDYAINECKKCVFFICNDKEDDDIFDHIEMAKKLEKDIEVYNVAIIQKFKEKNGHN